MNYLDTAQSLVECEHVDAPFIYRMLKTAAMIFVTYNMSEVPEEMESKNWIVRFLIVCKTVKSIHSKIEILEQKTLKIL